MKRRLIEAGIGLLIGGGLLVWVLRDFAWEKLSVLGKHWEWIALGGISMTGAHFLRAWRWQLMLQSSGHPTDRTAPWWALMVGYLVNTALPRVGEVVRCTLLWRWRALPVTVSLGTVIAERLIDLLLLAFLALPVVVTEGTGWLEVLGLKAYLPYLIAAGGIGLIIGALLWRYWFARSRHRWIHELGKGFFSILAVRPRHVAIGLSVGIWIGYWGALVGVMAACVPQAPLATLLWPALILLVGSGLAMALPVPGGIGTFHAIGLVLLLSLGWEKALAQLTVVAAHALQTLLVIALGLMGISYGALVRTPPVSSLPSR
ncbi:MAG: flippase-like domain-containing protein [Bacteroidia bacterium]|nr:flippase-like domain-containing protein [Bacteroidia bacterium]GIV22367.1 MAG: dolichol-P-glucose synthetase [Bacteroidia bacterium]